jgi:hypothetical protein
MYGSKPQNVNTNNTLPHLQNMKGRQFALTGKYIYNITFTLHKVWETSWVAKQLLVSLECLCSMELAGSELLFSYTGQTGA